MKEVDDLANDPIIKYGSIVIVACSICMYIIVIYDIVSELK